MKKCLLQYLFLITLEHVQSKRFYDEGLATIDFIVFGFGTWIEIICFVPITDCLHCSRLKKNRNEIFDKCRQEKCVEFRLKEKIV